jgi:CheY-like chemotaxis protein
MMPDMDGFDCCAQLRSLPEAQHTPILMITFLDDRESIERAFQVGATDYITKPIHWPVLLERIRRSIASAQALAQIQSSQTQLKALQGWHDFTQSVLATAQQIADPAVLWSKILGDVLDYLTVPKALFIYPEKKISLIKTKDTAIASGLSTRSHCQELPYYPETIEILPPTNLALFRDDRRQLLVDLEVQSAIAIPLFFQNKSQDNSHSRECAYLFLLEPYSRSWQASDLERITEISQLFTLIVRSMNG